VNKAQKAKAEKATQDALNDPEANPDAKEAARAVDSKATEPKKERVKKYNDEVVKRAIELRKTKGLGFLKVARAIADEFNMEVSPAALRAATMRYKGVESLNDLPKKQKPVKAAPAPASKK
jgi:hypothetical protein